MPNMRLQYTAREWVGASQLDSRAAGWYHAGGAHSMAKRKARELTRFERRRIRTQQVLFGMIAVLVIASFVISLIAR
jgi:hypothetical protein